LNVSEGRIEAGAAVVSVATTDTDLALQRARAERDQAAAQLRLLQAGARPEDVTQAEMQVAAATSDKRAIETELDAARVDEARYEQLLRARAGTEKQRDDAGARRAQAEARVKAAEDRTRVAAAALERKPRPEEIGRAGRVATADLRSRRSIKPEGCRHRGVVRCVASRLVEPGEPVAVGTPLVIPDLDHAWANACKENWFQAEARPGGDGQTHAGDTLPVASRSSPRAEFTSAT
jgi:multidrug resistance efflux pump